MSSPRAISLRASLIAFSLGAAALAYAQVAASMSPVTQRFVATAMTEANFIDEASNTALANGARSSLQQFARIAIIDQRNAHRLLMRWVKAMQPPGKGPAGVLATPLAAIALPGSNASLAATNSGQAVSAGRKAQLDQMQALSGSDFDRVYLASQRDAYRKLQAEYEAYGRTGDDAVLRSVTAKELPTIRRRIGWLKTL